MTKTIIALKKLEDLLPHNLFFTDDESLRPFECDGLSAYKELPLAVALPETVDQVQAILQICHETGLPVVPRGAGTGLSAGARPNRDALLLCLSKMNRIINVDTEACTITVEAGVRNISVSDKVNSYGLFYAPDPSSQIACSIGGNIAENAGGVHCLKYGLTVHNVLAATVVLSDGEIIHIDQRAIQAESFDLLAAIIGSEGMLGIVVEATLKLTPKPQHCLVMMCSFDDVSNAGNAVAAIIAQGIIPAGLEMMDQPAVQAVEAYLQIGYPVDAAAMLLCEIDGTLDEVNDQEQLIRKILAQHHAGDIQTASSPAERQKLWLGRKSAFPAAGRLSPDYYCMDGTIPRGKLAEVLAEMKSLSARYDLPVINVFHAGDGNLHPLILYDASQDNALEKTEQLGAEILELCIRAGGSITGEHGVGLEKINQMCVQFSSQEIQQFHRLKHAFDPPALLNPNKGIPTLHRCAEYGKMHVHHGQLPHSDLPRF